MATFPPDSSMVYTCISLRSLLSCFLSYLTLLLIRFHFLSISATPSLNFLFWFPFLIWYILCSSKFRFCSLSVLCLSDYHEDWDFFMFEILQLWPRCILNIKHSRQWLLNQWFWTLFIANWILCHCGEGSQKMLLLSSRLLLYLLLISWSYISIFSFIEHIFWIMYRKEKYLLFIILLLKWTNIFRFSNLVG